MIAYNNYPTFNFSITGITKPADSNKEYVYVGINDGKSLFVGLTNTNLAVYFNAVSGTYGGARVPANTWYISNTLSGDENFYSSTTNDEYPWLVTSWLPLTANLSGANVGSLAFNLKPFIARSIVVSGTTPKLSSTPSINGIYILGADGWESNDGIANNRPYYVKYNNSSNSYCWDVIYYNGSSWIFYGSDCNGGFDTNEYTSTGDYYYPWQVTWVNAGNHYNGFPSIRVTNDVEQRDVNHTTSPTETGGHRIRRLVAGGYV